MHVLYVYFLRIIWKIGFFWVRSVRKFIFKWLLVILIYLWLSLYGIITTHEKYFFITIITQFVTTFRIGCLCCISWIAQKAIISKRSHVRGRSLGYITYKIRLDSILVNVSRSRPGLYTRKGFVNLVNLWRNLFLSLNVVVDWEHFTPFFFMLSINASGVKLENISPYKTPAFE